MTNTLDLREKIDEEMQQYQNNLYLAWSNLKSLQSTLKDSNSDVVDVSSKYLAFLNLISGITHQTEIIISDNVHLYKKLSNK